MALTADFASTPVDTRLELIRKGMLDNADCDTDRPGIARLFNLLGSYLDSGLDNIDFLRGLLQVYKEFEDDQAYQNFVKDKLSEDERHRLESFVGGAAIEKIATGFVMLPSIGVREELEALHDVNKAIIAGARAVFHRNDAVTVVDAEVEINGTVAPQYGFESFVHKLLACLIEHKHEDEVKIWDNLPFKNWGQTVSFTPRYTVWPRTVAGITNIVRFAVKENYAVRCAGYRHSWSPIFGQNGQILLSMLDPDRVSHLPDTTSLPVCDEHATELESIEIVRNSKLSVAPGKTMVRVGAACTNERLRRWCIEHNQLTLPLNTIIIEVTVGGTNATMCHGAGLRHHTLSDLVRCIEYVDCHGNPQSVSDPRQLQAASGAFGLLGVVTHLTLEFDPMSCAELAPQKKAVMIAVPPPDDLLSKVPPALQTNRTAEQRQADIAEFERACNSDYYAEWFWFPYSDEAWINTWNTTADSTDVVDFPEPNTILLQWLGTVLMNIAQYSKVLDTIGDIIGIQATGTTIISRAAMWMLGERPVKTYLTDGLHFQRAVQNVRVRDLEVKITVPAHSADSTLPDWTLARRSWWDAIIVAYEHQSTQPQRMPLEMRITGDSNVIMAPQRGNKLGTCSIEVLTLESQRGGWFEYCQQVLDKWTSYVEADGKALRVRPHWAKEWYGHTVGGRPWQEVLKEQHGEEIKEFRSILSDIGKSQGWQLDELRQRFGNAWLDDIFFDSVSS